LIDDGERKAFEDMRDVLRNRLALDDPEVDLEQVIDLVIDVVDDSLGSAQAGDRDALHHEARRLRGEIDDVRSAIESQVGAGRVVPVFLDVLWAPGGIQHAMTALGRTSPEELSWLTEQFEGNDPAEVASRLVAEPPEEARNGSTELWGCIARFAQLGGAWSAATEAWFTDSWSSRPSKKAKRATRFILWTSGTPSSREVTRRAPFG
jgi:hypothetical protein